MRRRLLPFLIVPPALFGAGGFLWALVSLTLHVSFPSDLGWLSPTPVAAAEPIARPAEMNVTKDAVPPKAVEFAEPTPCGVGRVVLIVADSTAPADSMAVVALAGGQGMVKRGSFLAGRPVLAVTSSRVWLGGKNTCYVDQSEHAPAAPAKKPLVTTEKSGIERVDDGHVRIDRAVRDKLMETGGADLAKTFRVAPDVADGKMVGMRVLGVQEGSLLAKLGLRAGDSLRAVNGLPIGGPEQLLELYARLRTAPHLELELVRGGAKKIVEVEII